MNGLIAKTLDIGQRLFSLFIANALPAVTGGAVIGVSVVKASLLAGFMAVAQVLTKLAQASVDGDLTADEIKAAFSGNSAKSA